MVLMFVCWCDRRFGERDAFERHVVGCRDTPPTMRGRREDGSEAGRHSGHCRGSHVDLRGTKPLAGRVLPS